MEGGPPEFTPDSTWPALLGKVSRELVLFVYRTVTFYGSTFQYDSTKKSLCNSLTALQHSQTPPVTLSSKRLQASMNPVWAGSRSLAATEEVEVFFLFLRLLRCFSWPRRLHQAYVFGLRDLALSQAGFPIQKSPDQSLLSSSPKLIAATPRLSSLLGTRASTVYPL